MQEWIEAEYSFVEYRGFTILEPRVKRRTTYRILNSVVVAGSLRGIKNCIDTYIKRTNQNLITGTK